MCVIVCFFFIINPPQKAIMGYNLSAEEEGREGGKGVNDQKYFWFVIAVRREWGKEGWREGEGKRGRKE